MKASASVLIDRPVDEVFAFVADVERMDRWVDGVTEPRLTSRGPVGVGSTFVSKYTYADKTHDIAYVVTAHDPPRHHAVKSTAGPFPFEGWIDLEPVAGGTYVTNTIDAGSDGLFTSITFALLGPFLRLMMRRRLRQELEHLKSMMEAPSPAGAG